MSISCCPCLFHGHIIFMPPTLKKWGAYCFQLVCPCVRQFIRPLEKIQARVLKFHKWIPR